MIVSWACEEKPEIGIGKSNFSSEKLQKKLGSRFSLFFNSNQLHNVVKSTAISLIETSEFLTVNFQSGGLSKSKHHWSRTRYNLLGRNQLEERRFSFDSVERMTIEVEAKS